MERDYITFTIKRLIAQEEALLINEEKELKKLPSGTLIARKKKNNKWFYVLKENGKEHGITKDFNKVLNLARRQYLTSSSLRHKENITVLNKAYKLINVNKKKNQFKYTSPAHFQSTYSARELHWLKFNQSQNPYVPEHLIYKCDNGLMMRSKSERIIANKLIEHGIIFKYEAAIEIDGILYYPDFTILRKDEKIVLWEHNGLMNNEDYLIKSLQKIRKYKKIGFVQHKNLICTEEEDIRDASVLDEIIFRFIIT